MERIIIRRTSNEQREAIKICEHYKNILYACNYEKGPERTGQAIETALSLIKEQDKKIEHLKENIDYKTLCDFLMSSVSDEEEPIWTEKHIEELLDNFEVRWKDAHK